MRSIRSRLLFWILSGVTLLFAVTGCCIYLAVRHLLFSEVDEELIQARKVIYNVFENDALKPGVFSRGSPEGRRMRLREESRWREFDYKDGELVYQLSDTDGEILFRSPSLGLRTIQPPLPATAGQRAPVSLIADDGTRLRARIDYASPGRWPPSLQSRQGSDSSQIEIIVARDLSQIHQTLSYLHAGIWVVSLVATGLTSLLVTVSLRKGLQPLEALGLKASQVDPAHLTTRFDTTEMPPELLPICDQLNHLMERIEAGFDRERRFSSDLAHEMRTPVAEVCSLAESAILFPDKIPTGQFDKVLATGKRMQGIVESLLALSRWEHGSSELKLEEVDLAELVHHSWRSHASDAERKAIIAKFSVPPDTILETDKDLLLPILNNLLSNAVEYTPEGSEIRLKITNGRSGEFQSLIVSNPVIGMEREDVGQLFDRFWRKDPSRTSGAHCGLGLSIARACAEALSLELEARLEGDEIQFLLTHKSRTE